jgi:hypothetical protein
MCATFVAVIFDAECLNLEEEERMISIFQLYRASLKIPKTPISSVRVCSLCIRYYYFVILAK